MPMSGKIEMNDRFGNATGTTSSAAVGHYDRAVDAHLHAWPGVLEALDAAIAAAPDFALPHSLRALKPFGRGQRSILLAAVVVTLDFSLDPRQRRSAQPLIR